MEREDYKLLPLAAIGIIKGIGNVFLKPFIQDQSRRVGKQVMASIQYYRSPDSTPVKIVEK